MSYHNIKTVFHFLSLGSETGITPNFWITLAFRILNWGASAGLILGFICLLYPVTKRLLSARQRFWIWMVGWMGAYLHRMYESLGMLRIFPVTLRDLITPRTVNSYDGTPAYLPSIYDGAGPYNLVFPGGGTVQVNLNDWIGIVLFLIWLTGVIFMSRRFSNGFLYAERLKEQGTLIRPREPVCTYGHPTEKKAVEIYLCENLPTSFVHQSFWNGTPAIFLQRELGQHRGRLVLCHEANHIKLNHCRLKGMMLIALSFHWWNPLIWLAYILTCRDMELDCDARTMSELSKEEQREYARTLLELGAGKQLWETPMCFGESDAAIRVKAAVKWKPARPWKVLLTGGLTVIIVLSLLGGPTDSVTVPGDASLTSLRTETRWERLKHENVDMLVKDMEKRLSGERIIELWEIPEEGEERVTIFLCRLSNDKWCEVALRLKNVSGITYTDEPDYFDEDLLKTPDLTNCVRIY